MSVSPKESPPSSTSSRSPSPMFTHERKGSSSSPSRKRDDAFAGRPTNFVPPRLVDKKTELGNHSRRASVTTTKSNDTIPIRSAGSITGSPYGSPSAGRSNVLAATLPQYFGSNQTSPKEQTPENTRTAREPSPEQDPRSLLKVVGSLVKTRSGSVLARNTILKMDHFPSGTNTKLDFHLQGAPNFRAAELNVYGVAQPTVVGLSTILAVLSCHPESLKQASCTWFSTREEPLVYLNGFPYVLREYADPMQNMTAFLGINAARLEKVEERLKADIMKEAKSMGGLLLVHHELSDGTVVPCYIAADTVQTPREVFEAFEKQGYRTKYFRIPISPEQSPEDNYFDEYVRVIKTLKPTDPLIFNCGMGAVRTTVGIIIAQIIRRTQLIEQGYPDPFPIPGWNYAVAGATDADSGQAMMSPELVRGLEEADSANAQNRALLRLVYVLEKGLGSKMSPRSAIDWALERGTLIENLKEAIMGNYQCIVSLTSVLDSGSYSKRLLDELIDRSDAVINLREDILINRLRQTSQMASEKNVYLAKALSGLQRYFFLLCFTAYINESPDTRFETRFSSWVKSRTEIWTMLQHMKGKGPQLYFFRPVDNLRNFRNGASDTLTDHRRPFGFGQSMFEMIGAGSQSGIVASEVEEFILKARTGIVLTSQTILKIDFWRISHLESRDDDEREQRTPGLINGSSEKHKMEKEQIHHTFVIDGATHFRRVENTHVYGVAQPTVEGLRMVLRQLMKDYRQTEKILWINLREEPIIYINGIPYVLRDRYFTLRNIRVFKGITGARLEQLEERLKEDLIREIVNYDGRILLHGEDRDGNVQPVWEEVDVEDVLTVREVMEAVALQVFEELLNESTDEAVPDSPGFLEYHRVPVTAEKSPEYNDFDELRHLISSVDLSKTALIMNCQVGLGRSTLGTVIASLLTRWMREEKTPVTLSTTEQNSRIPRPNYQIINSLLRVIKNGLENKWLVDEAIDRCGAFLNLRQAIESAHVQMENEEDNEKRRRILKRGIVSLERYFLLICFQAYLDSTSPEMAGETESFEQWMKRHQEIETIRLELRNEDESLIVPVDKSVGDGVALSSEVVRVVRARHGQVLAQQTILKHDAFPGCQKVSLKEKVEGAYNFRRVEVKKVKSAVKYGAVESGLAADMERPDDVQPVPPFICGCAMPTKDAIKAVLKRMNAGPGGKRRVLWTCLREEPVLYVNKRPYVLRLFHDPLKNLETTGIARERVEGMEQRMRLDVLEELEEYNGRLLLHDEETTEKGGFILVPVWERVPVECVETPSQVFQSIIDEGYQVDYLRIPITDEQAPIPDVFDQLIRRMQDANAGVDVLFNCQMGRGRTTTGMVTACLMTMILNNDSLGDMTSSYIVESTVSGQDDEQDASANNSRSIVTSRISSIDDTDSPHEERERYENGEYRIILQLVSVLTYGKLAKRLTDQAINMCDHMQNLRKAVYDYKLRLDAIEDQGSKKYKLTRQVALNYLVRYFYLIVFANYLLEEMGSISASEEEDDRSSTSSLSYKEKDQDTIIDEEARRMTTFKEWLTGRREITNIIRLQSFDLS